MEKSGQSNKKARSSSQPICGDVKEEVVKPVVVREEGSQMAMADVAEEAPLMIDTKMNKSCLLCWACSRFVKPPVYHCGRGVHLVCGRCRGGNDLCPACDPPTGYAHSAPVDTILKSIVLPCPHAAYGCKAPVPYTDADDHGLNCAFAPCVCPEPGCGILHPPPALYRHLASQHAWPVTRIDIGSEPLVFHMQIASEPERRRLLVAGEGDDEIVFLLVVRSGRIAKLVRLRAAGAGGGPWWYKSKMWVQAAVDEETGNKDFHFVEVKVTSCAVANEKAAMETGGSVLRVCRPPARTYRRWERSFSASVSTGSSFPRRLVAKSISVARARALRLLRS